MRRFVFVGLLLATGLLMAPALAQEDGLNQVDDWCETGIKFEPLSGSSYLVPDPPPGTTWTLLVIKSATDNQEWIDPIPGQSYTPSNGHDPSHAILCYVEGNGTTTTTTTTSSSTTTLPDTTTTTPSTTTTVLESTTTTTTTLDPTTSTTETPEGGVATGGGACADGACDGWPWFLGAGFVLVGGAAALLGALYLTGRSKGIEYDRPEWE